jgi:capsular exopolysaccharide synthesis family protein
MDSQESRSLGSILWRRKWIIPATMVLALACSLVVSLMTTPKYETTSLMVRLQESVDVALFGTAIIPAENVQRDLVTMAEALQSRRVAGLVKTALDSPHSVGTLLGMIEATPSNDSNTITVKARGTDPAEAAKIADEFVKQTILLKQEADKKAVVGAREALQTQLALMSPEDVASSDGKALQTRIEQLTILESLQTGGYSLWQPAQVPVSPVSPRPVRDGVAGAVVGLVLGLIFAIVYDRIDQGLKEQSDFEREYKLPTLAIIPETSRRKLFAKQDTNGKVGFVNTDPTVLEAFRLLRSNLQYFELERGLRTMLITSGLPQEGKTSTAANLALGLAMSGARVGLVDSDLRDPLMHKYLHLDNHVGLSSVLAGNTRVEDAIQVVKSSDFLPAREAGTGESLQKNFLCLTSGPLPPNPAELLASARAGDIIKGVKALVDYVLIDSAPVLLVADAVNLTPRVDGVIIVTRAGRATAKQAREVRKILERVDAPLVGIVITAVKSRASLGYGHNYYHSPR